MSPVLEGGQVLALRYTLQRPLGRNDATPVWLARDGDGRDVVLKFAAVGLDPASARERLDRELAIGAAASHPALVSALRREEHDGRPFLVLPYLAGGEIVRLRGRPWALVVRRILPVIDALAALHAAGFVHGDVKSANVLLDADGLAQLGDLGSARPIGSPGRGDGSPYGMSPQRYAGEPAAVTDDVYAVGALLYELIGGYPPFYPDVSAERVRDEIPVPLGGRPAVPDMLREIVMACLAKTPAERPGSMASLRESLARCLDLSVDARDTDSPAPFTARVLRPPAEPPPIRPQWQRTTDSGPSAGQLRREGFRRGVLVSAFVLALAAVAFVFFVLPGLMETPTPAATTPNPPAASKTPAANPAPEPPQDLEKLAELLRQAETLQAPLAGRLTALEQRAAAEWGGAALQEARAKLAAGEASMKTRDYAAAITSFKAVAEQCTALEKQAPEVLRQTLAAGLEALDAGRSADARQKFAAALRIDATNAAARAGQKRAAVLDEVLAMTANGSRLEQDGDAQGAIAAYQKALALDPATRAARDGIARVQARVSGDAFSAAMARGLAALARKDYVAARSAFDSAGKLRPGSPEVSDGLKQVEQAERTRDLSATLERARRAESEERWAEALQVYRDALKSDPALLAAQQGIERCDPRAQLDAELQAYVDRPERLYSPEVRSAARGLLARATQVAQPGPRLSSQVTRVQQLLQLAETPLRVALASDNVTQVQIYRVGRLGAFERRDLELMPGRYTVVGTRSGYRDVRKEINLVPGVAPPELVIRCEEPI